MKKLELTWIGKENRPKLEPRILLEDPAKSYHAKHRVASADFCGVFRAHPASDAMGMLFSSSDRGHVQANLYAKVPIQLKAHVQTRKCAQLYGADTVFPLSGNCNE
jgi:hypothetical protein